MAEDPSENAAPAVLPPVGFFGLGKNTGGKTAGATLTQHHFLAAAARPVHGLHHFQRLVAFLARY